MTLRVDPRIKAAAEHAADQDHRSLTSLIEVLIMNHCKKLIPNPLAPGRQEDHNEKA
jgi:hypothetical protein